MNGPQVYDPDAERAEVHVREVVDALRREDPVEAAAALGDWCEITGEHDAKFLFYAIGIQPDQWTPRERKAVVDSLVALLAKWVRP